MERKEGLYRVTYKNGEHESIAKWRLGAWRLIGLPERVDDDFFSYISPTPIPTEEEVTKLRVELKMEMRMNTNKLDEIEDLKGMVAVRNHNLKVRDKQISTLETDNQKLRERVKELEDDYNITAYKLSEIVKAQIVLHNDIAALEKENEILKNQVSKK